MIRSSDSNAFIPGADRIIKAKGLNENTVSYTIRSNAFLRIPGKLILYFRTADQYGVSGAYFT